VPHITFATGICPSWGICALSHRCAELVIKEHRGVFLARALARALALALGLGLPGPFPPTPFIVF
jgi:hypothetical protein